MHARHHVQVLGKDSNDQSPWVVSKSVLTVLFLVLDRDSFCLCIHACKLGQPGKKLVSCFRTWMIHHSLSGAWALMSCLWTMTPCGATDGLGPRRR